MSLPAPARSRTHPDRHRLLPALTLGLSLTSLLAGCSFPNRDYSSMPDPGIIRVVQTEDGPRAVAPDCLPMLQPSHLNKYDEPRPAIAFGCATYGNLAGQLARPEDLVQPRGWGGPSATTSAAAVERYNEGKVTPLRETGTTTVGK